MFSTLPILFFPTDKNLLFLIKYRQYCFIVSNYLNISQMPWTEEKIDPSTPSRLLPNFSVAPTGTHGEEVKVWL